MDQIDGQLLQLSEGFGGEGNACPVAHQRRGVQTGIADHREGIIVFHIGIVGSDHAGLAVAGLDERGVVFHGVGHAVQLRGKGIVHETDMHKKE